MKKASVSTTPHIPLKALNKDDGDENESFYDEIKDDELGA